MRLHTSQRLNVWTGAGVLGVAVMLLMAPFQPAHGQADHPADHKKHQAANATADESLINQLTELKAQMARLQARLDQGHQAQSAAGSHASSGGAEASMGSMAGQGKQGSSMMSSKGGMSKMDMMAQKKGMGSMQGSGKGMMSGMGGMDGMKMMGMMGGMSMGSMANTPSALPGFPGASHLYHIGATGFFLDHPEHITLTTEQQTALNKAKEQSLLDQATFQRSIDEAEQELWVLTAADQPDATKIEAKVREIEKVKGDQRLAFIRAVGEAAKVLTDQQRQVLVGLQKPGGAPSKDTNAALKHTHTP